MTFDALKYARDLENAGFSRQQAEVQAEAMLAQNTAFQTELKKLDADANDKLATKQDLALIKSELQVEIEKMRFSLLKWQMASPLLLSQSWQKALAGWNFDFLRPLFTS